MKPIYRPGSITEFFANPRNVRLVSVLLITAFVIAFVVYITAQVVSRDLVDETFYIQALDENQIYDRVYTELLADPGLQDVSNSLLGNLNIAPSQSEEAASYAVSTLRLILPPETLQSAVEWAITEFIAYLSGDTTRYEASLNLSSAFDDPELGDKLTIYAQAVIAEVLAVWLEAATIPDAQSPPDDEQIAVFASDLERYAQSLSSGNLEELLSINSFVDIRQVPIEGRMIFADALLNPLGETATVDVRAQVETSLAAGDLAGAMTSATGELIRPYMETATEELQNMLDSGRLDGVESLAVMAESTEESIVGSLNGVRDVVTTLKHGVVPVYGLVMIASLAALGWIHAHDIRRAMRIVGATLILSGLLITAIWLAITIAVSMPLESVTNPDSTVPASLQNILADIVEGLIANVWVAIGGRIAIAFNIGVLLVFSTFVPVLFPKVQAILSSIQDMFEKTWGVSLDHPRNAVAATIAVVALLPIAFDILFYPEQSVSAAVQTCNGHAELCDRPLNEVVFAATHNSMSIPAPGWMWPSHDGDITEQLKFGIRGFLIDTHYWDTETQVSHYVDRLPEDMKPTVEEILAEQSQVLQNFDKDGTYSCHGLCVLGATSLIDMFTEFRIFLEANPDEVIVIIIQDAITPQDTETAFKETGLIDYVYTQQLDSTWPTLDELIERNQRVIVMVEEESPPPAWYMNAWDYAQENPYLMKNLDDFSCTPNRGDTENPLFLLNHWIDRVSPSRVDAARVNNYEFLITQARKCESERGLLPNLIAVNFYSIGDLMVVVDELNGVINQ
jgi:hypothetical protein